MKKRVSALLLIVSLFTSSFASSCSFSQQPEIPDDSSTVITDPDVTPDVNDQPQILPDEETATEEETAKNGAFDSILPEDHGGREFVILTTEKAFCESEDGKGIIGAELYARNRAIEEKFNIKITCVETDDVSVQSALQSGENLPDLVYVPQNTIASCGGSGLLMNIYSLPYFEYESEHTDPELIDSLSQSDTTYGVYGDAAYDERSVWCVYYNKQVLEYLGFPEPYDMVRDGSWTWDMFLAISEGAMLDADENGRMQAGKDRFGYSSSMNTSLFTNAVFASYGKKYFSVDEEGFLKMDFNISDGDNYIISLRNICVENKAKYPAANPGATALDAFNNGQLAFFCEKLSLASNLVSSPVEWGILPMPKRFTTQDGYCSLVDPSVCGYAVPQKVSDSSLSGKVLNAIYAYESSYGTDIVEKNWTYHYLPDRESMLAMQKAIGSRVYDVAYAFGEGMADFSMVSYDLLQSVMEKNVNFSYLYAQSEKPFSAFVRREFVH